MSLLHPSYFDYVELDMLPISDMLGLPKDVLELTGHQTRVVSIIGDAEDTVNALAVSTSPQDAIGTIVSNFAAVMELYVALTIRLNAITKGALPDTPTLKLAVFGAVLSVQPKEVTGVPEGFYATCRGVDIVKTLVNEFFTYLDNVMGGIFDAIFGENAMDGFLKALAPDASSDTIFAFAANRQQIGFFIQAPVAAIILGPFAGDVAGVVSVGCKVRLSDGHFSCEVDYKEPKWVSVLTETAVYVAKEAKRFFDETGKVIAVVAKKAGNVAVTWTKEAIRDAGKNIADGTIKASSKVVTWAKVGGGYVHCGVKYVADAGECGE
jgi:hypothetical protein